MKVNVLADVHVGSALRAHLSDMLESSGSAVSHAVAEGWADKQNGVLQKLAKAAGFTHLLTYDKNMADEHEPHMPVLVTDNPSHGEEGRVPGDMSEREIERMTLAAAAAVGERLNHDPPTQDGYSDGDLARQNVVQRWMGPAVWSERRGAAVPRNWPPERT